MLLRAARPENAPGIALFDEYNMASSAVLERFNPVLDDERTLVLVEKEGEAIRLHPDFVPIVAFNPPTARYPGRRKLSPASYNRHTLIYIPDLSAIDEQKEILSGRAAEMGVPTAVAEALVDLHHWLIAKYADGTLGQSLSDDEKPDLSIRQLMKSLETVHEFGEEDGYGLAFLHAVESKYAGTPDLDDNEAILQHADEMSR